MHVKEFIPGQSHEQNRLNVLKNTIKNHKENVLSLTD